MGLPLSLASKDAAISRKPVADNGESFLSDQLWVSWAAVDAIWLCALPCRSDIFRPALLRRVPMIKRETDIAPQVC